MIRSFLLLIAVTFITACGQVTGPRISSPNNYYNYGEVKAGTDVEYRFIVANSGDAMLTINKVITSCGCTAAEPEKKELKPGESTVVNVVFNTSGREGTQTKYISLASNDATQPQYRLTLTGSVLNPKTEEAGPRPLIKLDRTQHDFGVVTEGAVVDHTFEYRNEGAADLQIVDVKSSCGCTVGEPSSRLLKPGEKATIKVTFDTANRFGRTSRTMTLVTNDPVNTYVTLSIYAEILKKEN